TLVLAESADHRVRTQTSPLSALTGSSSSRLLLIFPICFGFQLKKSLLDNVTGSNIPPEEDNTLSTVSSAGRVMSLARRSDLGGVWLLAAVQGSLPNLLTQRRTLMKEVSSANNNQIDSAEAGKCYNKR